MTACVIAVGSELLTPLRTDTNSLAITERLNQIGCDVAFKSIVGDDVDRLVRLISRCLEEYDLVVCTGGLGPTEDDVTRDAVARALNIPLEFQAEIAEQIQARFAKRRLTMPEINKRQAMVPRGAVVLPNTNGTAPGLWIERGSAAIVLLPGPPREMIPMLETVIRERLAPKASGAGLFRRVLKITGRTESDVDSKAQPIYSAWLTRPIPIRTTILAVLGQIELHLSAIAASRAEATEALEAAIGELQVVLGDAIYSTDGRSLEAVVGGLLQAEGWTIAAAESCTGGLLSSRLTDVPGSSAYVKAGLVCYANDIKEQWLGVSAALIAEQGAVSEPVAHAMADGIRERLRVNVGIGITGIAGPGGGTPTKPVGSVCIAVVAGDSARVQTFQFIGGRDQVKYQSTQAAMNMLRLMMLRRSP